MFRSVSIAGATVCAYLAAVLAVSTPQAQASSKAWQRLDLDAIASDIAQRPVTIYCVESKQEWYDVMVNRNGFEPQDLVDVLGATWSDDWNYWQETPDAHLYLSLSVCQTLHALNPAAGAAGLPPAISRLAIGAAILTVTHEAVHKRLRSEDEALTECAALKQLPDVITRQFRIRRTVTKKYAVLERYYSSVRRRVNGQQRRVRVVRSRYVKHVRDVPSPVYTKIVRGAQLLNARLPAEYQNGVC